MPTVGFHQASWEDMPKIGRFMRKTADDNQITDYIGFLESINEACTEMSFDGKKSIKAKASTMPKPMEKFTHFIFLDNTPIQLSLIRVTDEILSPGRSSYQLSVSNPHPQCDHLDMAFAKRIAGAIIGFGFRVINEHEQDRIAALFVQPVGQEAYN